MSARGVSARVVTVLALLPALLLSACSNGEQSTGAQLPGVRSGVTLAASSEREPLPELPAYPLVSAEGATAALEDLGGEVAVVNFWASWCGPCRAEQPDLNEAYERLSDEPVTFLGVNFREDTLPNARAHAREFDIPYDSVHDPSNEIAAALSVPAIPSTVILDPQGNIAGRLLGITDADEVVAFAERLAREAA